MLTTLLTALLASTSAATLTAPSSALTTAFLPALTIPQAPLTNPASTTPHPLLQAEAPLTNPASTTPHPLLQARQTFYSSCPPSYSACLNLGVSNLCCASDQACAPDQAGYVACCPSGAVCTGTITGVVSTGTIPGGAGATSAGSTLFGAPVTTTATSTTGAGNGLVQVSASATAGQSQSGAFIIDGTSTVATPGMGVGRDVPRIAGVVALGVLGGMGFWLR